MQAETQEMLRPRILQNAHKPARLKKARQFQHVRQQGRSVGSALLTLGWAPNALAFCRCGYTVGKRVGGAVTRNRVKRRLREIIRLAIKAGHVAPGYDLVLIARTGAAQATYEQLATDVTHLLQRAHLWQADSPEGLVLS
ncbi:MAG TPA: ribonuclease P protein component [Ktedonobacterales bacterium]|jgi:ribonuclease P protein component